MAAAPPPGEAGTLPPGVIAAVALAVAVGSCKGQTNAGALERHARPSSEALDVPARSGPACGPRGLPPDRHFVAEGHCARVVASKQGALQGLTFAMNGDLLAITRAGRIMRYRDVDRDGLYADGPPETVVWASTGSGNGHSCSLDDRELYCGSRNGVTRWRYAPDLDDGGPGQEVITGMPAEGPGEPPPHPVGIAEGFLYVRRGAPAGDAATRVPAGDTATRRFALATLSAGKALRWSDGAIVGGAGNGGAAGARSAPAWAGAGPPLGPVAPARDARFALAERWRAGAFVVLQDPTERGAEARHEVIWVPFGLGAEARPAASTARRGYEIVFGGGRYGAPREGEWSWRLGDAGEDPVRPVGAALSPLDGALYVSSDNGGGPGGSIYRIAFLGR
jgi:hypothetical protein